MQNRLGVIVQEGVVIVKARKHSKLIPCALGSGKSLEEVLKDIDSYYDNLIRKINVAYDYLEKYPESVELTRHQYYIRHIFDKDGKVCGVMSREDAIKEEERLRNITKRRKPYDFRRRTEFKDNQNYYNCSTGGGGDNSKVRIPSMKRSRRTWKNFYKLFPGYKELSEREDCDKYGFKLKRI